MKRITIKDIAKLANVSPATVSLVLNDKKTRISDKTSNLIKKIARNNNYLPNFNAKSLVSGETKTIGLIIPDIENPFFAGLAKILELELKIHKYSLIIISSDDNHENDINAIKILNLRSVDGFLLVLSTESYNYCDKIKNVLTNLKKPYVLVDRIFPEINCSKVSFNNYLGEYLATKHIIKKGYKKIGFIAPPKTHQYERERKSGFLKAMREENILIDEKKIKNGNFRFDDGYKLTEELLKEEIDAIVVSNDIMAYGAIKKINETGKKIPEDIALIGYDDLLYSDMLVALTTIRQDKFLLGKEAIRILLKTLKDSNYIEEILLTPELIIRKTT